MSYLLDRKIKRHKAFVTVILVAVCFSLFYFRSGIFYGLSSLSQTIFHPVLVFGNNVGEKFSSASSFFKSKSSLLDENNNLKSQLNEMSARVSNYSSVFDENLKLKEILGRK